MATNLKLYRQNAAPFQARRHYFYHGDIDFSI